MSGPINWTPELDAKIIEISKSGMRWEAAARLVGISVKGLKRRFRMLGIEKPHAPKGIARLDWTPALDALLIELCEARTSWNVIAKRCGVSIASVRRRADNLKIGKPNASRWRPRHFDENGDPIDNETLEIIKNSAKLRDRILRERPWLSRLAA